MVNHEKSVLRADFKPRAEDFFAKHAAELESIHARIAERLALYIERIFPAGKNQPRRIAVYEPMRYELPAGRIVRSVARLRAAELLFPEYDDKAMWFVSEQTREKAEPDFIIVPGLFVDNEGRRLGRGKGYYDRYLAKSPLPQERHLFLGYPFQFLEFVPTTAHDRPVAFIHSAETSGR